MFKSARKLYGNKLGASDGELGHVKDLYFDDRDWTVRYLVVDTGSWLPGRQVLIPPHAVGNVVGTGTILPVNLTRSQIENSPSIATHKPVSRQYEDEYHRYYGWPTYWEGESLGQIDPLPIPGNPVEQAHQQNADLRLRSMRAVEGYHIQATDRINGHVCDFLIDGAQWRVCRLVVKTGHRFSGREVEVSTGSIVRISYEESTVFVNLSGDELDQIVQHQPAAPVTHPSSRLVL